MTYHPFTPTARERRRANTTCLDGGTVHAWNGTGLDVRAAQLVSTRRCVWCGTEHVKPYGARRAVWRPGR